MPAVSFCPRCQKPVSLPAGVNPTSRVRCPLCDAEYELREATPPRLIPVAVVPHEEPARAAASQIKLTHAEASRPADEENEAVLAARTLIAASRVPKPPVPRSPLKLMAEIVFGGLAGCLVAYYGLAFYLGPEFKAKGLPELPLPFIDGLIHPNKGEKANSKLADEEEPSNTRVVPDRTRPVEALNASIPSGSSLQNPTAEVQDDSSFLRPRPGSSKFLGPRLGHSVGSDELAEAVRKASAISIATSGDLMPPKIYEAFCQLGSAITFVNGPAADTELVDRIAAAGALLEKAGQVSERFDKIGQLAREQLSGQTAQNAGILLAGTVKGIVRNGRLWTASVQLPGQSEAITIVGREPVEANDKDRVLALGVVVREPEANLVGYAGTQSMVVWVEASVKVMQN